MTHSPDDSDDRTGGMPRRPIHHRAVHCTGYVRDDGLIDIEGEMRDITPTGTRLLMSTLPPGAAIHHMCITLTVDRQLYVHDVVARIHASPTHFCTEIETAYAALKGLRIGNGFRQRVRERVGGVAGCTHMTELLGPLATTAFQCVYALLRAEQGSPVPPGNGPLPRPTVADTCHNYRSGGQALEILWPRSRRLVEPDGSAAHSIPDSPT